VLAQVRGALPPGTPTCWDMTILAYWAWSAWDTDGAPMHSAQGAGGLGLRAAGALGPPPRPVAGARGVRRRWRRCTGIAELATAVQQRARRDLA